MLVTLWCWGSSALTWMRIVSILALHIHRVAVSENRLCSAKVADAELALDTTAWPWTLSLCFSSLHMPFPLSLFPTFSSLLCMPFRSSPLPLVISQWLANFFPLKSNPLVIRSCALPLAGDGMGKVFRSTEISSWIPAQPLNRCLTLGKSRHLCCLGFLISQKDGNNNYSAEYLEN